MARVSKNKLKSYFETGDTPTQAEFEDLIDSLALQEEVDELKKNIEDDDGEGDSPGISTPDIYISELDNKDLGMPEDVGGLLKGTKVSDLEGKTFSELVDEVLFPTVVPVLTNPTADLSLTGSTLREVGAAAPSLYDLSARLNRGSIVLVGELQNLRSGELDYDKSYVFVNNDSSNKLLPETMPLGMTSYKFRAYYEAGPQPYDNKGNAYDAPLPAGYVDSNVVTVYGTYPWYATTAGASAGVPLKQALIRWNATAGAMATPEFTLLPTDTCTQVISVPREITELYIKDASGNFILSDLTGFEKTTETRSERIYYRYTYTGSGRGSITLKIKF